MHDDAKRICDFVCRKDNLIHKNMCLWNWNKQNDGCCLGFLTTLWYAQARWKDVDIAASTPSAIDSKSPLFTLLNKIKKAQSSWVGPFGDRHQQLCAFLLIFEHIKMLSKIPNNNHHSVYFNSINNMFCVQIARQPKRKWVYHIAQPFIHIITMLNHLQLSWIYWQWCWIYWQSV